MGDSGMQLRDFHRPVQAHSIEIEPDYDVVDYGTNIDNIQMEYDHDMEELLRQLPSRQLGKLYDNVKQYPHCNDLHS